ncbi:hypothetical protein [Streptomyces sp. CNZ748]|nr:hypothetical protein [Streptomyces sp. CNZ748]
MTRSASKQQPISVARMAEPVLALGAMAYDVGLRALRRCDG